MAVDMDEFRSLLDSERERIETQIAHLHEDTRPDDEIGELAGRGQDNHLADMASVTLERELDEGLEEGAHHTLDQINRALAKLDDGSFGVCERCGKPIGEERLRARPWATLCIDDQRLLDGR